MINKKLPTRGMDTDRPKKPGGFNHDITLDRPTAAKLLAQIRRAPGMEQLAVLEWLVSIFPKQAKELSK
ncbi:MAG: hypothetical protein WA140_03825 [Geobacteraceae bacterium]